MIAPNESLTVLAKVNLWHIRRSIYPEIQRTSD